MPRPPSQAVEYTPAPEIPEEEQRAMQASAWSSKWILIATAVALGVLFLLCLIGPHLPGGE